MRHYGRGIDTLLTVRWVAEAWPELMNRIRTDPALTNREAMLELLSAERDPDRRERLLRERFPGSTPT